MNVIFVSELADKLLINYLKSNGIVITVPKDERFDPRISSHPDLIITIVDNTLIIDQDASEQIFKQLDNLGIPYVTGNSRLSSVYPEDIAYNAVVTTGFLIHNLNYTNQLLFHHCNHTNKKLIHVKQGYTKCSTVVVGENSFITSDEGIYEASKDFMNLLLIQQGNVLLEGYDYGFIGGTSGVVEDTVIFHGDLSKHPDFFKIASFLKAEHKKLLYFKEFPLTDIGSILVYSYNNNQHEKRSLYQKHVNIPIFISHEGCPNDCVFCNQRKITAKAQAMTLHEVEQQIQAYCSTLDHHAYVELAFFGGSFTGIDTELQEKYLKLAHKYKKSGRIQAIRLSTRPDYISNEILDRLKFYGVDIIELGVQSLQEEVLKASNRGHQILDVYQAVTLIKTYGFQLGIQLMVGLPEDTKERSVQSAKLAALLKPDFIRIYPTLVIKETELSELYKQGKYIPLSIEEAVDWTKEMYQVFLNTQIPVIRMGLQPTDLIAQGKEVLAGPFHPAFRQLVESSYFLDLIKDTMSSHIDTIDEHTIIKILCNPKDLSQVIGHNRSNIISLKREFLRIQIIPNESIRPLKIAIFFE